MFYLRLFIQLFKKNMPQFLIYSLALVILFMSIVFDNKIENTALKVSGINNENSYFNALLSTSINFKSISRKLRELPGVKRVQVELKEKTEKRLNKLVRDLKVEVNTNFVGIRIQFRNGIAVRTKNLIREYLLRLIDSENIHLGPIITGSNVLSKNKKDTILFIKRIPALLIFIALLLFLVSAYPLRKEIVMTCKMSERFQRRRFINLKFSIQFNLFVSGIIIICLYRYVEFFPVERIVIVLAAFFIAVLSLNNNRLWTK